MILICRMIMIVAAPILFIFVIQIRSAFDIISSSSSLIIPWITLTVLLTTLLMLLSFCTPPSFLCFHFQLLCTFSLQISTTALFFLTANINIKTNSDNQDDCSDSDQNLRPEDILPKKLILLFQSEHFHKYK